MSIAQDTQFEIGETESIEEKIEHLDKPYRDADVLRELYWNRGLSQSEVGDELGCSGGTVSKWLAKNNLGARDKVKATRDANRVERATFDHDKHGYGRWTATDPDGTTQSVGVHRLLAIAEGADPAEVFGGGTHVHHRTGVPWLNLPDGVEVVTPQEHSDTHRADEWTEVDGIPMLVTQRDDE